MPQGSKPKKQITFARLKAVSRDIVYLGTNPDDQELGTPFTAICQYNAGEWSYETFPFALSDMTLFKAPSSSHRVLYILFEKGIVVDFHTKTQETIVPPTSPLRTDHRLGYLLKIKQIGDHLYASGSGGQVYRRSDDANWSPLDISLLDGPDPVLNPASELRLALSAWRSKAKPSQEEIDRYKKLSREAQAKRFLGINGLSESSIYVCCDKSEVYWFDGSVFKEVPVDSEDALLAVSVESEDRVWVCGREGTLLRGNHADGFRQVPGLVDYPALSSMAWYDGKLYLGSYADPRGLFVYEGGHLLRVRSGLTPDIEDVNMIEAVDGVLWVMGTKDLLRFDGSAWERIAFPGNDPVR